MLDEGILIITSSIFENFLFRGGRVCAYSYVISATLCFAIRESVAVVVARKEINCWRVFDGNETYAQIWI
jgi:hypothetical protein